jgi:hypothetical protein
MLYPNFHSVRLQTPGKYDRFVVKRFGKGISAILGFGGLSKYSDIQALRFDKNKWTMLQVKKWITQHGYGPKVIKYEPAREKMKCNPEDSGMTAEDLYGCITYFINDETKGIAEYEKFLKVLPVHKSTDHLRSFIKHVLSEEKMHLRGLKTFMGGRKY